jgi:hypothetical protein
LKPRPSIEKARLCPVDAVCDIAKEAFQDGSGAFDHRALDDVGALHKSCVIQRERASI